jgi:hypothetical protein
MLVPYATTVRPITRGETPNLRASPDAPRTRKSAPQERVTSPKKRKRTKLIVMDGTIEGERLSHDYVGLVKGEREKRP